MRLADRLPIQQPKTVPLQPRPSATEDSELASENGSSSADARFRAELQKQPPENLKRFCAEIGVPSHGNKAALVDRLAEHAREHHARMQQQKGQQSPQVQQQAQTQGSRPATGASSSSRLAGDAAARPASGMSVASLSLEEQKQLLDELTEKARARPGTAQSTATSFVAASAFGGAKAGAVFKKDARGLGYYRDA